MKGKRAHDKNVGTALSVPAKHKNLRYGLCRHLLSVPAFCDDGFVIQPLFGQSAINEISILLFWVRAGERGMEKQINQMEETKYSNVKPLDCAIKFQVYGEIMLDKEVGFNGSCGRIYLPGDWVGHRVKIIRID